MDLSNFQTVCTKIKELNIITNRINLINNSTEPIVTVNVGGNILENEFGNAVKSAVLNLLNSKKATLTEDLAALGVNMDA